MNDKLCKRLRRKARALTVGKPQRAYIAIFGKGKYKGQVVAIGNEPHSTRGVYRALKKEVKCRMI
jgi:hypothetical protein